MSLYISALEGTINDMLPVPPVTIPSHFSGTYILISSEHPSTIFRYLLDFADVS